MQFTRASVLAALVAYAAALQVTSPTNTTQVDFSKDVQVTWQSVSSDPSKFSVVVVNMAVTPSVSTNIADDVSTSSGSYTIKAGTVKAMPGQGFQVNLISKDPQNTGILAQSNQFTVVQPANVASSGASSGSATGSATASASAASGSAATKSASATKASGSATGAAGSATGTATSSSAAGASSSGAAVAQSAPVAAAFGLFGLLAMLA